MPFLTGKIAPDILTWLRETARSRYTRDRNLDPFATSMRDFDDVAPQLGDLEKGQIPEHAGRQTQRLTDLRNAKFADEADTKLTPLGQSVINKWREFNVADNQKTNELARHIIVAFEASRHSDPDYTDMLDYWSELRQAFPAKDLLDNWDYLYALNYLDFERGGITPGIMFRQSKLPLDELDLSFKSFVESVDPTNEEALKGAVGVDNGIGGQIPRGRHRATFCLAMETMLLKPNDAVALVKALGIANQPREWENLPQGSLQKIEEILISYQAADKASANQKLAAPISPEKAISEIDLADEEVETPLKEITLPDQIDFTKVKVPPPTASAPPKKGSAGGSKSKKKIDYKKKTAQSALTGNAGEKFVFSYEKDRLAKFPKLAEKIEWISQKDDSQGYDVISFEENGTPRYIEVKSTTGDANTDFYISRYEIDKANELGSKYKIYRVFNLGTKSPQFFEIELPLESTLELVPETYRARIKPKKP